MNNLLRRLRGQPPLVTIALNGLPRYRMETHGRADTMVSAHIEAWRSWDGSGTAVLLQMLRQPADFIDIGANIGWYTLFAAHALAGRGQVHSFEPDPAHLAKLRANIAVNRLENVTVNGWALSDRTGTATLHRNPDNWGDNSLLPSLDRPGSTTVELRRLDDYAGLDGGRPLLIKIDVQGSELAVLGGARHVLETHAGDIVIYCEFAPDLLAAAGGSAAELAAFLEGLGFAAALVDRRRLRIIPMSWSQLVEWQVAEIAGNPHHDADVLAYRDIAGLMAPIFGQRR
jgi:FkbM family methyltransferase